MKAFHDDKKIKAKYLKRVKNHRLADNLVQGKTWENGKGCAIGCTLENYNHVQYETELGIPEWLARCEDTIFEGLDKKEAQLWPEKFLSAINPGADLNKIEHPFIIFTLESSLKNFAHKIYPEIVASINTIIELHKVDEPDNSLAWNAARSAAKHAAWNAPWSTARSAARSAARNAARSAAESVAWRAAESAARNAARSAARSAAKHAAESVAESATWSAAESVAYRSFADELIRLIKECVK